MFRIGYWTIPGLALTLFACASAWSAPPVGQNDVAAHINGKPVTIGELDAQVLKTNRKLFQQLYDARRAALDTVLIERLLAPEAAKSGKTAVALFNERITARLEAVTDKEIEAYYKQNRGQMRASKLAVASPKIRTYLVGQKRTEARNSVLADLKRAGDVKIVMGPPRSPMVVADNDPTKGPATAKVTILEFSDFQ